MTGRIVGTGCYLPEHIVTNDDLGKLVETSDEWISERTGIHERHISLEKGTSWMGAEAAKRALFAAGMDAGELELIILATSTQDNYFPAGACEIQAALGAYRAAAFDLSAACSGFLFALNAVNAFICSGIYQNALVIGAEMMSKLVDWQDRRTCILFGDGAGAVVLRAEETGIRHMVMGSDGMKASSLFCKARTGGNFLNGKKPEIGYISMDGQEIFKFAVKKVPECILQVLSEAKEEIGSIKYFILHQANRRIIEAAARRLKQPLEKFPMDMEYYGNTSSASIPILLHEMDKDGRLQQGDKLILAGFGAGLTWGSALIEW